METAGKPCPFHCPQFPTEESFILVCLKSLRLSHVTLGLHRSIGRSQFDIRLLMSKPFDSIRVPIGIFFLTRRHSMQGIAVTGI